MPLPSVEPSSWRWINHTDRADHRGLIAQDVAAALGELDNQRGFAGLVDENGELGLCMTEIVGPMIGAI
jgi:hypothetical protein